MFCESRTINNVIAYVNEYYINSKGLFNAQSNECLLEISGQQELYPFGKDHLIYCREVDFGQQKQHLPPLRQHFRHRIKIHLGLTAAGDAVQQKRLEAAEGRLNFIGSLLLVGVELKFRRP